MISLEDIQDKLIPISAQSGPTHVIAPLPPSQDTTPDQIAYFNRPNSIPFIRHSPLPAAASGTQNAAIAATAKTVAEGVVASAPGNIELDVPTIFTPASQIVKLPGPLSITLAAQPGGDVLGTPFTNFGGFVDDRGAIATGLPPGGGLPIALTTNGPNEWAFAFNSENNDVAPGGWTVLPGSGSMNFTAWGRFMPSSGTSANYVANVEGGQAAASGIVLFGTTGFSPVVSNFYSTGSLASPFAFPNPTAAHDTIIVVVQGTNNSNGDFPSGAFADTQGNSYFGLTAAGSASFPAVLNESLAIYAAFDAVGGSNTLSWSALNNASSIVVFVVGGISATPVFPRFMPIADLLPETSVTSINTLTGDVVLAAGANVTITPSGQTLTIASSGGSGITSINSETGPAFTIAAGTGITVTTTTNTATIAATGGGGASFGRKVVNTTTYNQITSDIGKALDVQTAAPTTINLAGAGIATITYVQSKNSGAGSATFSLTFTSNVTAANTIMVFARLTSGSGTPTVTDSLGNVYTLRQNVANGSTQNMSWDSIGIAGGACTVTIASSFSFCEMIIAEYSGIASFDTSTSGTTGTGATATSPSITTAANDELVLGWVSNETSNGLSITQGSGYTQRDTANGNVSIEDKILSTAGSTTASFGLSSSVNWFCGALAWAPTITGTLFSGWVQNNGSSTVAVTPTTGLINGASSVTLAAGHGATICTDNTNFTAVL